MVHADDGCPDIYFTVDLPALLFAEVFSFFDSQEVSIALLADRFHIDHLVVHLNHFYFIVVSEDNGFVEQVERRCLQ